MNRLASVRFDRVLSEDERAEAARVIASAHAQVSSWNAQPASGRTYALLTLGPQTDPGPLGPALGARVDAPPLVVLSVVVRDRPDLDALQDALGGRGRPAGVLDCRLAGEALLLELDDALTPLALLVDVIDVVVRGAGGRRILPLLGLRDESLAAFAAATLAEPALDASRLVETWLDGLREANAAR